MTPSSDRLRSSRRWLPRRRLECCLLLYLSALAELPVSLDRRQGELDCRRCMLLCHMLSSTEVALAPLWRLLLGTASVAAAGMDTLSLLAEVACRALQVGGCWLSLPAAHRVTPCCTGHAFLAHAAPPAVLVCDCRRLLRLCSLGGPAVLAGAAGGAGAGCAAAAGGSRGADAHAVHGSRGAG